MNLRLMTLIVLPTVLAGTAAAQTLMTCPGAIANIPHIYMPGPRIAPYMPMPEFMPGMPTLPAPRVMPIVPRIIPIMPEPRVVPFVPMPGIMPIMTAVLNVQLAAPAKDVPAEETAKEFERLFDGRQVPARATPVKQPVAKPVVRPSRPIGLPEQDLENEIGVVVTNIH